MKNKVFILFIFSLNIGFSQSIPTSGNATNNDEASDVEYFYDFSKRKLVLTKKNELKVGSFVHIVVKDVNPYLYQTSIETSLFNFNAGLDKPLTTSFIYSNSSTLDLNISRIKIPNIKFSPKNTIDGINLETTTGSGGLKEIFKTISKQKEILQGEIDYIKLNTVAGMNQTSTGMNQTSKDSVDKEINYRLNEIKKLEKESADTENLVNTIAKETDRKAKFLSLLREKNEDLRTKAGRLETINNLYNALLSVLYTDGKKADEIKKSRDELIILFMGRSIISKESFLQECSWRLKQFYISLNANQSFVSDYLESNNIQSDKDAYYTLKDYLTSLNDLEAKIEKFNYSNFFNHIMKVYDAIYNANFEISYYSKIPAIDELDYKISIIPIPNLVFSNPIRNDIIYDKIKVKGGIKIDVSSGIFFNLPFGIAPNTFNLEQIDSNSVKITQKQSSDWILPSIGVLMHVYKRTNKWHSIGGCLGLSTNNVSQTPNYHVGGSWMIGRGQRVVLSAGCTISTVKVLDSKYDLDKTYSNTKISDPIPTINATRLGLFISFTYNLSKGVMDVMKSSGLR